MVRAAEMGLREKRTACLSSVEITNALLDRPHSPQGPTTTGVLREWVGGSGPKHVYPLRAGAGVGPIHLVDHARKAKTHTEDPP